MRLFKRRSHDQSPELVSATPINQDGTAQENEARQQIVNAEEETKTATMTVLSVPRRRKELPTPGKLAQPKQQQGTPSTFSAKSKSLYLSQQFSSFYIITFCKIQVFNIFYNDF